VTADEVGDLVSLPWRPFVEPEWWTSYTPPVLVALTPPAEPFVPTPAGDSPPPMPSTNPDTWFVETGPPPPMGE
jgi:hypothetical protein